MCTYYEQPSLSGMEVLDDIIPQDLWHSVVYESVDSLCERNRRGTCKETRQWSTEKRMLICDQHPHGCPGMGVKKIKQCDDVVLKNIRKDYGEDVVFDSTVTKRRDTLYWWICEESGWTKKRAVDMCRNENFRRWKQLLKDNRCNRPTFKRHAICKKLDRVKKQREDEDIDNIVDHFAGVDDNYGLI